MTGFNAFDVAAILIVLAAIFGYINFRFLKLPASVGMTAMGAVASLVVVTIDHLVPGHHTADLVSAFLTKIDFQKTLMNGMLSFLLFAGALHVDWSHMHKGRWPILVLSTVGVVLSTVIVAAGFYVASAAIGFAVPFMWCLVFGALISPTDPVAVMAVLKRAAVPPTLSATVAGESLFNDGVGVVVFTILLASAMGGGEFSLTHAGLEFVKETGGGVLLGLVSGYAAYLLMQSIDDYNVEVMITLAVVMGGYALAQAIGISGPVAMAVAGLVVGNAAASDVMSDVTRDYVMKFWSVIDEILNAILFLLIGLEIISIATDARLLLIAAAAIPIALAARFLSVAGPFIVLKPVNLGKLAMPTLVWGGLRGGISVALALGLPEGPTRMVILAATYGVVLFAVIIQGGTIAGIVSRAAGPAPDPTHTLH